MNAYTVVMFANDGLGAYVQRVRAASPDEAVHYGCSQAGILGDVREDIASVRPLCAVVIPGHFDSRELGIYEDLPELPEAAR